MDNQNKATILTYTGKTFHILSPTSSEIDIRDIAHALSNSCRFTGHTKRFYSVAEHSYLASLIVPAEFALEALLHDASEAYIGDMSRPLKHFTEAGKHYLDVERRIEAVIADVFGLPTEMSPEVKTADNAMLYAEKYQLMPARPWDTKWSDYEEKASIKIVGFDPPSIEDIFLHRFLKLMRVTRGSPVALK